MRTQAGTRASPTTLRRWLAQERSHGRDEVRTLARPATRAHLSSNISGRQAVAEAAIAALVAGLMSMAVFGPILRWIGTGWSGGDMLSTYVDAELWRGFGYGITDQFGFPLGIDKNYFPAVDITENNFAQAISWLTDQPFVGVNLLILLTFPLVAFLAYFLFRMTGLTGPLAIAGAAAFSLIPFHFGRALGHTYLSTLYSAVTGVALVLLVGSGRFEQIVKRLRRPGTSAAARVWTALALIVLVVVTAWTGVYYAAFTLILGAAALIWRFAHRASWRALALDATPFVAIGVLVVAGVLPSLLSTWSDPPLGVVTERLPYESVIFAGFLAVALLPLPQSNLPGLDFYNRQVTEAVGAAGFVENSAPSNYGTWVTAGSLLVIVAAVIARNRYPHLKSLRTGTVLPRGRVSLDFVLYLLLATVLWFIPWGLNYLFAGTVTAQIRAWNRLTPYLLLFLLLGAAAAIHRTKVARNPRWAIPIAAVVLALTFVDAVLPFRAAYADNARKGAELTTQARSYAEQANGAIPERCGVLQLPYMGYPEVGVVGDVNDYDHFWVSINNPNKGWSYGAIKSTDAGIWSGQLPDVPSDEQMSLLRGAGFCAIHVDRRGWPDSETAMITGYLTDRFGDPIATANDGKWAMFDIRSVQPADEQATQAFLRQPFISADPTTTHPRESELTDDWWWTRDEQTTFTLTPTDSDWPVRMVSGTITAPSCGPRPVTVTLSAGEIESEQTVIALPDEPTPFELALPSASDSVAELTVFAPGPACESGDEPGVRFAQVGGLRPY